jgi:hypothetical protein
VSHGSVEIPLDTVRSMKAGSRQLPPLCPGSIPTTTPVSGRAGRTVVVVVVGIVVVVDDEVVVVDDAVVVVVEDPVVAAAEPQPASPAATSTQSRSLLGVVIAAESTTRGPGSVGGPAAAPLGSPDGR